MNPTDIIAILETITASNPAHMVPQPWRSIRDDRGVHTKWSQVFAGNVTFAIPGWLVVVFNDCNGWDYIDAVIASDGTRYDVPPETPLFNWTPTTREQQAGWSDAFASR